jgi:senataxin
MEGMCVYFSCFLIFLLVLIVLSQAEYYSVDLSPQSFFPLKFCFSNDFRKSILKVRNEARQEVFSLLSKLSSGWRESPEERIIVVRHGTSSELLEQYRVNDQLKLIWTVDIIKENSNHTQILKVWDVLPSPDLPKLARHLDDVFGNYTVDKMNRCKHKFIEG